MILTSLSKQITKANSQSTVRRKIMLSWVIGFLVIALIAAFLGFSGVAGTAAGIAQLLFVIFLVLFVVSLIFGRRTSV